MSEEDQELIPEAEVHARPARRQLEDGERFSVDDDPQGLTAVYLRGVPVPFCTAVERKGDKVFVTTVENDGIRVILREGCDEVQYKTQKTGYFNVEIEAM